MNFTPSKISENFILNKLKSIKTSARKWIQSMKLKGHKNIICFKCNHTHFSHSKDILKDFMKHILDCDPSRV